MGSFQNIVVVVISVAAFLAISPAVGVPQSSFVLSPEPTEYSMHIREFHECVSCNDNKQARKDYNHCLQMLSEQNRNLIKDCCVPTFDKKFCSVNSIGDSQFSTICMNPKKALEVGRCFWKKTSNKNSSDIETYRTCKRAILSKYCTSFS